MKSIIIVGASGMIGSIVLKECLNSNEIGSVISIARRPSTIKHAKLEEIIHKDFTDYSNLKEVFSDIDIAHFCIGVYAGQVPDDTFKIITVDFAKAFGDAVKQNSSSATLCFLSGAGADLKEKSRMPFARYKGMAENYLMAQNFEQLYIFRPAYIYPVEKREEPNMLYRVSRKLYPLMKKLYPNGAIESVQLGKSMFKAGISGADKTILENKDIKEV